MPTLHLICGLPCSGKTTLAKRLEEEHNALRLTPDEWIAHLYGPNPPEDILDAARDPMESVLWDLAVRILALGIDVILDFGFWSRTEREDFRLRAANLGASCRIHYLEVQESVLFARLAARNAELPDGVFHIEVSRLREWIRLFEPPVESDLVTWSKS